MVNKFKPGIPDNFKFDVAPVNDLGDFLDEQPPTPPRAKQGREVPPPNQPRATPVATARTVVRAAEPVSPAPPRELQPAVNADAPQPPFAPPAPAPVPQPEVRAARERPPRVRAPRREINMTPETLRMSDELLEMIRRGSGQRDTKANEVLHALVLLVYEVKDELDLHVIPKRGRWGSPTARAYPVELKNAFFKALRTK